VQQQFDSGAPIVVIGAGIIGLMTAYALSKKGCQVTVIDRLPAAAEMCSRANAGIIAVGHAQSWGKPEAITSIFRALLGREPGVRISKLMDPQLWRWGLSFLRHCTRSAHHSDSKKLLKLSLLSSELLASIEADKLSGQIRHQGGLYLFKDANQFGAHVATPGENALKSLDREQLIDYEPWLVCMRDQLVGGLLSQQDGVGDCYQFSQRC
jgi:D-amino-acid dehydrogenase